MIGGELGKVYRDGEIIFREGDPGQVMYMVQFGQVQVTKKTATGELTLATLSAGDLFGEMALFDRLPRSATAVARGEARVLSIDKRKLLTTMTRDPSLAFHMLAAMSQRIRQLDAELATYRAPRAEQRT